MKSKSLFFCGIGGSGMLPLAMIAALSGYSVTGSDRSFDAGRSLDKKEYLEKNGIAIVPQTGEGLTPKHDLLIVSTAIEDTIPEVVKAKSLNIPIKRRAEVLAEMFNNAKTGISIAGTSGKSTTTAMVGWCLKALDKDPTMMNGASLCNLVSKSEPYASFTVGKSGIFVTECDESDGSAVFYKPAIAVLTNISLDHMPIEKLVEVFQAYLANSKTKVVNLDNKYIRDIFGDNFANTVTFALNNDNARFRAQEIKISSSSTSCLITDNETGEQETLTLKLLGKHNVENALAAISALSLCGVTLAQSVAALNSFTGVKRRLETLGTKNGITVIDDFGHNPEKIEATLKTLHEFDGRVLAFFQMHGYGPLKLMKDDLIEMFRKNLKAEDKLYIPDVLYLGGTANKSYDAEMFCNDLRSHALDVTWKSSRDVLAEKIAADARQGDRIVIMGARDDSLSQFAQGLLFRL